MPALTPDIIMNEDNHAAAFRHEGDPVVTESTEEETPAAPQAEEANQGGDNPPPEGDNTQGDDDKVPFHKHPRWTEREEEWTKRFNEQEARHQEDLKSIREEFGEARKENRENTEIPSWFGGTQEQWAAYRKDRDQELKQAEERAIERLSKARDESTQAETKAVEEATAYLNSEVAAIEADKALNPTGAKIDKEALLKVVLENELIDSKGRWNYRAGMKILSGQPKPAPKAPDTREKKEIASATGGTDRGETKPPQVATSETFKKERPW